GGLGARGAGGVRGRHDDADGRPHVLGDRVVRRAVRAGDVGAGAVAALPLIRERDRLGAGPRAGVGGERRTRAVVAGDGRAVARARRHRGDRRGRRRGRGGGPARVVRSDGDPERAADLLVVQVVGPARGARDRGARGALGVAALPLVGERDGGRAGPLTIVGGQRPAVGDRPRDARRRGVLGRLRGDGRGRGGRGGRGAAVVAAGDEDEDGVPDVGRGRGVGGVRRAVDVAAVGAGRVAPAPLVGERHRRGSVPGARIRRQRLAVARGAVDPGRGGVHGCARGDA